MYVGKADIEIRRRRDAVPALKHLYTDYAGAIWIKWIDEKTQERFARIKRKRSAVSQFRSRPPDNCDCILERM